MSGFIGAALLISLSVAFGFYILFMRTVSVIDTFIPWSLKSWLLTGAWGRLLLDFLMFAGTIGFMFWIAGASQFAMAVGALAGLIGSAIVQAHASYEQGHFSHLGLPPKPCF